jgi:hypothetical protein
VRVPASILAAALAIAAASGCGADSPARRLAYTSIDRSRAHAIAHAVALRAGDLPEFKTTAKPPEAQQGANLAGEVRCRRAPKHGPSPPRAKRKPSPSRAAAARSRRAAEHGRAAGHRRPRPHHAPSQAPWASANSDRLSAGSGYHVLGASSSASIMATAAAARLGVAEGANLDDACLAHAVRRALSRTRLHVTGVVVKPLSLPVPGADASAAYQTIVGVRGAPLILYMDSIVFAYGQDAVTLTTYHSSKPVSRPMEERLLGLLVARARAHAR